MLTHLTAPRLSTIQAFFKTTSDGDILGCYAWNQAVAASLLPILGDFEIALRNSLHRALSQHYGQVDSFDWMMPKLNPAWTTNNLAPKFLAAKHKTSKKTKVDDLISTIDKIKARKPLGYLVTPDDVVAAVTFGFWETLISGLGHTSHATGLQASILKEVFPHAPDIATVPYGHAHFKARVQKLLKMMRDVRNRIGHHDSLWTTPEFNHQGVVGFIPRRPRHTVKSLHLLTQNICWFADWIDPSISNYIKTRDHWNSLQLLISRQALTIFRQNEGKIGTYKSIVNLAKLKSNSHIRKSEMRRTNFKFRNRLLEKRYFY